MFKQLSAILERTRALHEALLSLAQHKREVVISGQIDRLNELLKEEEQLVDQLEKVEEERLACVRKIIPDVGEEQPVTISQLLERMDAHDRNVIQEQMKALLHLVEQLKLANEQNQELVQESLNFTQHTLNVLTANPTEDYLYTPKQSAADANSRTSGLFDRKA